MAMTWLHRLDHFHFNVGLRAPLAVAALVNLLAHQNNANAEQHQDGGDEACDEANAVGATLDDGLFVDVADGA